MGVCMHACLCALIHAWCLQRVEEVSCEQAWALGTKHGPLQDPVLSVQSPLSSHRSVILMQNSQNLFSITIHVTTGIYFQNCNFWYCYDEHFWIHIFFVHCFGSIFKVPSLACAVACVEGSKLVVSFSVMRLCSAPSPDHPRAPFFFLIIFGDKVSSPFCNRGWPQTCGIPHASDFRVSKLQVYLCVRHHAAYDKYF